MKINPSTPISPKKKNTDHPKNWYCEMGTMKNETRHSNAEREKKKTFRVYGGYHPKTKNENPEMEPSPHRATKPLKSGGKRAREKK